VNFLTLITEFAAISLALQGFGLDPLYSVPVAAVAIVSLVVTGSYMRWERMVVGLCLLDIAWFAMAYITKPEWGLVAQHTIMPTMPPGGLTSDLVFLMIAIVGTTIAPWQLFFQQSCIADKPLRFADLKMARIDTFIGACFTILVGSAMLLVGDYGTSLGVDFQDPAQMALAIFDAGGSEFIKHGILLLMINAAVLGTTAVSLSSAWAYGEVRGWNHSLQKSFREAPGFYIVYVLCIAAAAGVVLIPNAPLQTIIISVQVFAGLVLPSAIIFLQLLLNDKEILGEEFVNKRWNNVINWIIIAVLFALSLVLAVQTILPDVFA